MTVPKDKRLLLYAFTVLFIAVAAMFALSISLSAATAGDFTITPTVNGEVLEENTNYSYTDGVLTIHSDKAMTIANADTNTATTDRIEVAEGVSTNITLAGVNIDLSSGDTGGAAPRSIRSPWWG